MPVTNSLEAKSFRRVTDELSRNLEFLARLGDPEQQRDAIILFAITNKFDKNTAKEWEGFVTNSSHTRSIKTLELFLNSKAEIIEKLDQRNSHSNPIPRQQYDHKKQAEKRQSYIATTEECPMCKSKNHKIYRCSQFLRLPPQERSRTADKVNHCQNCLKSGHRHPSCQATKCRVCNESHNTLLHHTEETVNNSVLSHSQQVLLSTIGVTVHDSRGKTHQARALLDSGSQSNYVTYEFLRRININPESADISIRGITNAVSTIKHKCQFQIKSNFSNFKVRIPFLVMNCITDHIPKYTVHANIDKLIRQQQVELSDPFYNIPSKVDLLIGADLFWKILHNEKIDLGKGKPCLRQTEFGWIVAGGIDEGVESVCNLAKLSSIQTQLQKFWELEEVKQPAVATCPDDQIVEKHFSQTCTRNAEGRFVVRLPFKDHPSQLGDSRKSALKRFNNLESKFKVNRNLKTQYFDFMSEYESLHHMKKLDPRDNLEGGYYLPHHAVLKADSLTTKCRIVFDASAATTSGKSLNNILHIGPVIQQDLNSILMRFRQHSHVFVADITKMYRQVLVASDQTQFQRILWRPSKESEICTYELQTVTYGTGPGSFLATRCLKQLALDHREILPEASEIIQRDFYVDDLISGSNDIQKAKMLCKQVSDILASGCFKLNKWCSNDSSILEHVDQSSQLTKFIQFGENSRTKLLGIQWCFTTDTLAYHVNVKTAKTVTKRTILSETAKIFDPLGLLAPVIIVTKIIIQQLWLCKRDWDDEVPNDLKSRWLYFNSKLESLNQLCIPRFVLSSHSNVIELHGFCDASQDAYGACVYVRSIDDSNQIEVSLLTAKGRVAPLKVQSIPWLELCGALLLAELMKKVEMSVTFRAKVHFWTDSQVTLCWIKNQSKLFQPFVANRISKIQDLTNAGEWDYVHTLQNPADLISRGMQPDDLVNSDLWWQGPTWLSSPRENWDVSCCEEIATASLPEVRKAVQVCLAVNDEPLLLNKYSSLIRLKRVTAWCLRFGNNSHSKGSKVAGPLLIRELDKAFNSLTRIAQLIQFRPEIQCLSKGQELPTKNRLKGLAPYLDESGVLGVGGRLKHSNLSFETTHPILLSAKCHLTRLIFEDEHMRLCHGGAQLLLYTVRQRFWVIGGRNLARSTVHKCIVCARAKPKIIMPIMGDLPAQRVQESLPFIHTGTDFAGPFSIKERKKGSRHKTI